MIKGILGYAHYLLKETIQPGETVVDATCGNGNDTLYLSKLVGDEGSVFGFDIQKQAIENTKQRLLQHNRTNVTLIHDSHANISNHIQPTTIIGGAIFNLGYLPKSDKSIITKGESTTLAIHNILKQLKEGGLIIIVVYHGHPGGQEEKESVLHKAKSLDQKLFSVLRYDFINQKNNPPFLLAIQKNTD
ncbi:methyltransferase domain-containing protein [Ornithinibacillus sp. L9]|uniref:Methyltransferase domain-containing protein n=1 Tax=Ornithinibacillus caprae TaxID=2678566 RepID=A0A6N8FQU1_9BACI|nr:class I SAM-dependent methyltransferase [Ornithinibacillus caprae]MUK90767.1 methyltransferase domain-containing protein [Ornithinibacillus caprae]